eukprot:GEMP01001418.1.p1 GENE.GEMP01001418.1~~GEMP01001418.1.p1  ORF type:complete len:1434 (+),score=419.11 GEMP01001418.1:16-4317(+)
MWLLLAQLAWATSYDVLRKHVLLQTNANASESQFMLEDAALNDYASVQIFAQCRIVSEAGMTVYFGFKKPPSTTAGMTAFSAKLRGTLATLFNITKSSISVEGTLISHEEQKTLPAPVPSGYQALRAVVVVNMHLNHNGLHILPHMHRLSDTHAGKREFADTIQERVLLINDVTTQHDGNSGDECIRALHVQGHWADNGSSLAPSTPCTIFENSDDDKAKKSSGTCIAIDVCSSRVGRIVLALRHDAPSMRSIVDVTIRARVTDTEPFQVLCHASGYSRRIGHTLTSVGPWVVMFGGRSAAPDVLEALPTNDLWSISVEHSKNASDSDGKHVIRWESFDEEHTIYFRPLARYGHVATGTSDGLLVIYGGHSGKEYLRDLWAIRLLRNSISGSPGRHKDYAPFKWKQCFSPSNGPQFSLFVRGDKLDRSDQWLLGGGQNPDGSLNSELWQIDLDLLTPHNVRWWQITPYAHISPEGRFGHSMNAISRRPHNFVSSRPKADNAAPASDIGGLLLFGGVVVRNNTITLSHEHWYYDAATQEWAELHEPHPNAGGVPMPGLAFHSAATVGDALVVIGGIAHPGGHRGAASSDESSNFEVRSDVWRWHNGTWSLQHRNTRPREFQQHSIGGSAYWPAVGKVVLYGGQHNADAFERWYTDAAEMQREADFLKHHEHEVPIRPTGVYPPMLSENVNVSTMHAHVLLGPIWEACAEHDHDHTAVHKNIGNDVCLPCSNGTIYKAHQTALAPWLARKKRWVAQCVPCDAGTIWRAEAKQCAPCPAGFRGEFRGMVSWKMCWPCRAASYSSQPGSAQCSPCTIDATADDNACPMMATSPTSRMSSQKVREVNEPHGRETAVIHAWWQWLTAVSGATLLIVTLVVLILLHSRRPRETVNFLRRFDKAPITGSFARTEAGGVVLIVYVLISCFVCLFMLAHHFYRNADLTTLTLPAEEEFARAGQIAAHYEISAALVGYSGPCLASDDVLPGELVSAAIPPKGGEPRKTKHGRQDEEKESAGRRRRALGEESWHLPFEPSVPASSRRHHARVGDTRYDGTVWMHTFEEHDVFHLPRELEDDEPSSSSTALENDATGAHTGDSSTANAETPPRKPTHDGRPARCHPLVSLTVDGFATRVNTTTCRWLAATKSQQGTCVVSYKCHSCTLTNNDRSDHGPIARLNVHKGMVFTAAREIRWKARTDWIQKDSSTEDDLDGEPMYMSSGASGGTNGKKAFSVVEAVVNSGGPHHCLRGPEPSVVRMTLVPTDYRDLINAKRMFGFVVQYVDSRAGSSTDSDQFHEFAGELNSELQFTVSHSLFKLVLAKHQTGFDFLAQMLGFLSGMSLIARILTAVWNDLSEKTKDRIGTLWGPENPIVFLLSSTFCFWIRTPGEDDKDTLDALDAENPTIASMCPTSPKYMLLSGSRKKAGVSSASANSEWEEDALPD